MVLIILSIRCGKDNTLSSPDQAQLIDYSHGTCDKTYTESQFHMMSDSADVEIIIDGLQVTVIHKNAVLNCCLDSIVVEFSQEDNLLKLTETEETKNPCLCLCDYEVEAIIEVPAPGTYIIEIWTVKKLVWREEIEIPGS
jgi:hypothetical protein